MYKQTPVDFFRRLLLTVAHYPTVNVNFIRLLSCASGWYSKYLENLMINFVLALFNRLCNKATRRIMAYSIVLANQF